MPKTKTTSLRLEEYFYPGVRFEANRDFDPDADEEASAPKIFSRVVFFEDRNVMRVEMTIESDSEACDSALPYQYHLKVFGVFRYEADLDGDEDKVVVVIRNALSILYGSAREYLLVLTSRAPWGGYPLPTVTPRMIVENIEVGRATAESSNAPETQAG